MGKRNKIKQMLSPSSSPPPQGDAADDDELMDELLNELDSRNPSVKSEASTVLSEMQQNRAEQIEAAPKQDSKSRFQARAVRIMLFHTLDIEIDRCGISEEGS